MNSDFFIVAFISIFAWIIIFIMIGDLFYNPINDEGYKEEFSMDSLCYPYFKDMNLYRIARWIDVIFYDGVSARLALEERFNRDIITNRVLGIYCTYVFWKPTDKNCKYKRGDIIDPDTIKYITAAYR